jgi:SAM-dependent methyltransferase
MLATANALTPAKLSVDFIRAQAEQLPFPDAVFDLVLTTLSLRHWTDPPAGIAEIGRVLTVDGVLILADVFPRHPHPVRLLPCCADAPPRSQPTLAGCWPFTAWPLSAAIAPAGSDYRTSRSSPSGRRPRPAAQGQPQALVAGRAGSDDGEGDWLVHGM